MVLEVIRRSSCGLCAMDLPNLFSNTIDPVSRLFICSVITDSTLQSLLVKTSVAGTKIIERSAILTYTDAANLVVRTDESLQELGKESENVSEVIFALETSWLKEGTVIDSKKSLLQSLVQELSLKPLGFVVQSEALAQFVLASHSHVSAVVIMIDQVKLHLFVIAQGKVGTVVTVGRSEDVAADVKEGLARFLKTTQDAYLPAKMLCVSFVLDEKELLQAQQELLEVKWEEVASFVQTPTIDLLKADRATSILAHQAAVAATAATADTITAPPPLKGQKNEERSSEDSPSVVAVSDDTAAQFGFATVGAKTEAATVLTAEPEDDSPRSFGIPIRTPQQETAVDELENDAEYGEAGDAALGKKRKHNPYLFSAVGFGLGVVILLIVGYVWLTFYSRVIVAITPENEVITEQVTIILDPALSEPDSAALKIPAETTKKELSTQEVLSTTGIKILGEKATGKIKIQNKTTDKKTFGSGSVIKAQELEFVIDEEVTVPAAVEEGDTKKYGTASVAVTAVVIGAEGNLNKDTTFTVGSFDSSSYSAVSEEAFSGGSSREVKVVAEADKTQLIEAAKKKMLDDAKKQFSDESGGSSYYTPPISITVTKTEFSAEVEEPADQLAGTITAEVTALAYRANDLQPIAQAVLGSKVPSGFILSEENPEILSDLLPVTPGSSEQKLKASLSAQAVPNLQLDRLAVDITGLSPEQAREKLAGQHISKVEFTYLPIFAQTFAPTLPKDAARITVQKQ